MLIGINGFKGSGKDTVADYLVENYDFEKLAFADKLKDGVCALFDITREQIEQWKNDPNAYAGIGFNNYKGEVPIKEGMDFRTLLQRFGTEMGRGTFGWDFWIDQLLPGNYSHLGAKYAISDCRFENEMVRIKELGGSIIRIERPGTFMGYHVSEHYPSDYPIDYVIDNDGDLEDLYEKVEDALVYLPGISGTST